MLSSYFESILQSLAPSSITEFFIWLIATAFIALLLAPNKLNKPSLKEAGPAILTSIGILGTFIGIVVGLLAFDAKDIDGSIEALLSGLKTAFITSVLGMGLSVVYKVWAEVSPTKATSEGEDVGEADADSIYQVMVQQANFLEQIQQSSEAQTGRIEKLRIAISGDGEDALTSQLKLLRSDANDNAKVNNNLLSEISDKAAERQLALTAQQERFELFARDLKEDLHKVGEMLSKSATEQVVEALKNVIQDFNSQLTEQFGQNFKELNSAVHELVKWQESYRLQMEEMIKLYALGVESIDRTETSVTTISEHSESIPSSMDKLGEIMETNQHQLAELERHLSAFKEMRDKAIEAVPQMQEHLDSAMKTVEESVKQASSHYEQLLSGADEFQTKQAEKSQELYTQFVDTTSEGIKLVGESLQVTAKEMSAEISSCTKEASEAMVAGTGEFVNNVHSTNQSLQSTADTVSKGSEDVRQQLEDAVVDLNGHFRVMVEDVKEQASSLTETLKAANNDLATNTREVQLHVVSGIEQMQQRLESSLQETFQQQTREVQRTFGALEDQVKQTVGLTGEAINEQLQMIDHSMQQEVQKVMEEMGRALVTISGRFTQDYQKLVQSMDHVVRAGNQSHRASAQENPF